MYLCNFRDCHYPSPVLPAFKSFGMSIMSAEAYVSRAATVFNELKKPYARNPRLCGRSGGRVRLSLDLALAWHRLMRVCPNNWKLAMLKPVLFPVLKKWILQDLSTTKIPNAEAILNPFSSLKCHSPYQCCVHVELIETWQDHGQCQNSIW